MNINERIKALRESAGMTQEELGAAVGVSDKVVSKWECGETKPSVEILPALADVFGVNIDDLYGRTHDCRKDLLTTVRNFIQETDPEQVFDRMQEIVSYMVLGAEMRRNRDGGWYKPDILQEIDGELLEMVETGDERPQIFQPEDVELLTNIRNDRLRFAVMQQYPGDMFGKILDRYDLYRPVFEFLAMEGADALLKAAYDGTLPADVTADYASEMTGAPAETVLAFMKLTRAREMTAVIRGEEVQVFRWCWYTGTNLRAVIGAAYLMTENWGGHR